MYKEHILLKGFLYRVRSWLQQACLLCATAKFVWPLCKFREDEQGESCNQWVVHSLLLLVLQGLHFRKFHWENTIARLPSSLPSKIATVPSQLLTVYSTKDTETD